MAIDCLADIVRVHGAERPDHPALELEGRTVTFRQLDERSSRVAAALATVGVGTQDRVAVIDKNGIEGYELLFGLAKLNAVAVNVNWRLAPPEIAQIITDAEVKAVVAGPELVPTIEAIEGDLAGVKTFVAIGGHDRWLDYESWVADRDPHDPGTVAQPSDVAYQLYTSGTTGLPKGVMLTTANAFTLMDNIGDRWSFTPESVNLAVMPMFHIAGLGWASVGLYFGCQTVVMRDVDPSQLLELIPRYRVSHLFAVPAVIQFLLLTPGVEDTDFSSLQTLVYGASPIAERVLVDAMALLQCDFVQVYGATETTGAVTQLDAADHDPEHRPELLRSCGKPYPWVEMRVVDPSTGEDAATGEVGEFWVRSPQVMAGYWNQPEATAAAITEDGWFKTGDAGYRDGDGYLYLHDRVKDMIVSGGENIYPAEVENALMQHPAVTDVAVIGVPDERWGEAVKAIVVPVDDPRPEPDELIAFCRQRLAGFKCPKSVDFASDLPRNPSGKLLKRDLREPYWATTGRRVG